MVVDYQQGKIYKVWSPLGDLINIGSTCQPLNIRFNGHKSKYRAKGQHSVNIVFDAYGIENCQIELIELCPCNNKKELFKCEGKHQRLNVCTNKAIADRGRAEYLKDTAEERKQYRVDNKEHIKAVKKAKYQANKELIKQKAREHYNANKERKLAYQKEYALIHKDKIKLYKAAHHKAKRNAQH